MPSSKHVRKNNYFCSKFEFAVSTPYSVLTPETKMEKPRDLGEGILLPGESHETKTRNIADRLFQGRVRTQTQASRDYGKPAISADTTAEIQFLHAATSQAVLD